MIQPKAQPLPAAAPASQLIKKFTPHPAVAAPAPQLPPQAAAQVDKLKNTVPTGPGADPSDLQKAMQAARESAAPSALKIGSAMAAIAIMVGAIWFQNSPKLAFHNAATKAGINASLPTYIPSSYRQTGPVSTGDGQLTLSFSSPGASEPLVINQNRSNWDSSSLRENYIDKQTTHFSAVEGQGLTIYVYDDKASWINHGVWYQLSGTAKLSREQVLKIAYGL